MRPHGLFLYTICFFFPEHVFSFSNLSLNYIISSCNMDTELHIRTQGGVKKTLISGEFIYIIP